jgi:hypothetical protein
MNTQIAVVIRRSPSVKAAEHRRTPKRFVRNTLPTGCVLVADTEAASSHSETHERSVAPSATTDRRSLLTNLPMEALGEDAE